VKINLFLYETKHTSTQQFVLQKSGSQFLSLFSIKLKPFLAVTTLAESILYLHAVAEYKLSFAVSDLLAGEQTYQLSLALLATFQL
jgi:hypothetical protein